MVASLRARGCAPASVLEPTCGAGSLLVAALDGFPTVRRAVGVDLDGAHLDALRARTRGDARVELVHADALRTDWRAVLAALPRPVLVVGNPPWVMRSTLATLGSANLPPRTNLHGDRGIDAITGRGNFDLGEWLLLQLIEASPEGTTLAMLCKTSVARRVLAHAWARGWKLGAAAQRPVDARRWWGASVGASLLVCEPGAEGPATCAIDGGATLAWRDGVVVNDLAAWERWRHLVADKPYTWRSGVKHDAGGVMELLGGDGAYTNDLGESVSLEPDHVYPLLRAADLARGDAGARWLLVPQRTTGGDTASLERTAPKTWRYLDAHGARLDARRSRIYRGRPRFSVFGVGAYTFSPWKVAVSALHRPTAFRVVGPRGDRPVVLDDTSYFYPCATEDEARAVYAAVTSEPARALLAAMTFADARRPVTAAALGRLDLARLADAMRLPPPAAAE